MKHIAVVAGTPREFDSYRREVCVMDRNPVIKQFEFLIDGERHFFVHGPDYLRGMTLADVVYYGTWTNRTSDAPDESMRTKHLRVSRGLAPAGE